MNHPLLVIALTVLLTAGVVAGVADRVIEAIQSWVERTTGTAPVAFTEAVDRIDALEKARQDSWL